MRRILLPVGVTCLLLIVWEAVVRFAGINPVILPAPSRVVAAAIANGAELVRATGVTLLESVLGFILATIGAIVAAIGFVHSRTLKDTFYPYAVALKATPIIAIAPLLVLWAGNGLLSKVIMAALVAFFPVLVSAVQGLTMLDAEVVDLVRSVDATRWTVLWRLRVPASLPYLFPGLRVASTLAVVGAVIGEFTGATMGAGHLITVSSYYLETPLMFAAIASTALVGLGFFGAVALVERRVVFWRQPSWN